MASNILLNTNGDNIVPMPETITVSDDVSITKEDNGEFVVNAWGSVEIFDKENQKLSVEDLIKDAPMMMAHKPKIHLGHTDTEVGELRDLSFAMKTTKDGNQALASKVKYALYGDRRFHKAVRAKVEAGEYGMLSVKGFAYNKTLEPNKGGVGEVLHDIETVTYALCKQGMNPEADNIDINGVLIGKSSDLELVRNPDFNRHVVTYMKDGLTYQQAMSATKEIWSNKVNKAMLDQLDPIDIKKCEASCGGEKDKEEGKDKEKDEKTEKGGTMPDDIEALKKELEVLKAAIKEKDTKIDELTKAKDTATPLTKEDITTMVKAQNEAFVKSILEKPDDLMKALGFQKAVTPPVAQPTELMKGLEGDENLKKLYELAQKGRELSMNTNLEAIPSVADMEKAYKEV